MGTHFNPLEGFMPGSLEQFLSLDLFIGFDSTFIGSEKERCSHEDTKLGFHDVHNVNPLYYYHIR